MTRQLTILLAVLGSLPCLTPTHSLAQCVPDLEVCDGADNDCDGSVDEVVGDRYVAATGVDTGNLCADTGQPCATISHAVAVACDHEIVRVAEGEYLQDVVIDHPISVRGTGLIINTHLQGTGTGDVVKIRSSNVTWGGVTVWKTPGVALMHIGDATHPNLRNVVLDNATFREGGIGVILESTGSDEGFPLNRFLGMIARDMIPDGSPHGGTGVLLIGGNGRLQISGGRLHHNGGGGLRVLAPPPGSTNRSIVLVGEMIYDNGLDPLGASTAGVEFHDASDVQIEGNDFFNQTAGAAVVLDDVQSASLACNRLRDGQAGLTLANGTALVSAEHNLFQNLAGTAIDVDATSGASSAVHETLFTGNGVAIHNHAAAQLDAGHCWFGAATGPGPVGAGDDVLGPVYTAGFTARASMPVLVRRPTNSGWGYPTAACFDVLQDAVDLSPPGSLLLIGKGEYYQHVTIGKSLELEGLPGGVGCSPTILRGDQGGTVRPTMLVRNTSNVRFSQLTIRSAAQNLPCGSTQAGQIGLDLQNVQSSRFDHLCLADNGVTDLRVYGDSDDNLFEDISIDGATRNFFQFDQCGHRSREGILVDGGAACEGGGGATADRNVFRRVATQFVARGIALTLATATTIDEANITAEPAAAWNGGAMAIGVDVQLATNTTISGGTIGNTLMTEAVRGAGRSDGSCVAELTDSAGLALLRTTLRDAAIGLRLAHAAPDPGRATNVSLSCSTLRQLGTGVQVEDTGLASGAPLSITNSDISGNGGGVNNLAVDPVIAQGSWWGAASGPSGGGPGSGDSIAGNVDASGWLVASATLDVDGDGISRCAGDCGYTNGAIYPGASEVCDGFDNDCDNGVDNVALPSGVLVIQVHRNGLQTELQWSALSGATGYDVIDGDVPALRTTSGDFSVATTACLAEDTTSTTLIDGITSDAPGATFYLARGRNCGGRTSYDSAGSGQVGLRDAEIAASPNSCP